MDFFWTFTGFCFNFVKKYFIMFFILDFTDLCICFTFKIKSKKKLKDSPYPTSNIPKNLKILLIMTFNYHYIDN